MNTRINVAIVGGGILAISALHRLVSRGFDADITLIAEHLFSRKTCSFRKGGFVDPFLAEGEQIPEWTRITYEHYRELQPNAPGIYSRTLRVYLEKVTERPEWLRHLPSEANVRDLGSSDFPSGFEDGFALETIVLDQERLMLWKLAQSLVAGVKIEQRRINSLAELEHYDAVIHCTGLGATELGAGLTVPIRGQWVLLRGDLSNTRHGNGIYFAPEPEKKHLAYLVGGDGWTLVGGTSQYDDANDEVDPQDEQLFFDASAELVPEIHSMEVIDRGVQHRPGGGAARVEETKLGNGTPVFHGLCPGGSGITLAEGYAHVFEDKLTEYIS